MLYKVIFLSVQCALIHAGAIPDYEEYNYQGNNLPIPDDYSRFYTPKVAPRPATYPVGAPVPVYRATPQGFLPQEEVEPEKVENVQQVPRPLRLLKKKEPAIEPPVTEEPKVAAHYDYGYSVSDPQTGDSKTQYETRRGDVVTGSYSVVDADGTRRTVDYTADAKNGFNAVVRKEKPEPKAARQVVKEVREGEDDLVRQETAYQKPIAYKNTRPYPVPPRRPLVREEVEEEAPEPEYTYEQPVPVKKPRFYAPPSRPSPQREELQEEAPQDIYNNPIYVKKSRQYAAPPPHTIIRGPPIQYPPQQEDIYVNPVVPKSIPQYVPQPQHTLIRNEPEEDVLEQEVVYQKPVKKTRQRLPQPRRTIIRDEYVSIPSQQSRVPPGPIYLQPSASDVDVQQLATPNYNRRVYEPAVKIIPTEEGQEYEEAPTAAAQVPYLGSRRSRPDRVELQKKRPNPLKSQAVYEEGPDPRLQPVGLAKYRTPRVVAVDPKSQPDGAPPQAPYYVITRFVNMPHPRQRA